ncbi:MAG: hypothetical protein AAF438_14295, partial [Pseudomonadota bacterium]
MEDVVLQLKKDQEILLQKIEEQTEQLSLLKTTVRKQQEQIDSLTKTTTAQKSSAKLRYLRVSGDFDSNADPKAIIESIVKKNLGIDVVRADFDAKFLPQRNKNHFSSIAKSQAEGLGTTTRESKKMAENSSQSVSERRIILVEFYNFWARRSFFGAKKNLKDSRTFEARRLIGLVPQEINLEP